MRYQRVRMGDQNNALSLSYNEKRVTLVPHGQGSYKFVAGKTQGIEVVTDIHHNHIPIGIQALFARAYACLHSGGSCKCRRADEHVIHGLMPSFAERSIPV
jgi:hypothetical protein